MIDLDINQLKKILAAGVPRAVQFEGKKAFLNKNKIKLLRESLKNDGGLLPLAALLPLIFGGITAAAGTAAGIASSVKDAKEAQLADARRVAESQLADARKAAEPKLAEPRSGDGLFLNPAMGSGIFLNPEMGRGLKDFLKQVAGSALFTGSGVAWENGIEIKRSGEGIYLNPVQRL